MPIILKNSELTLTVERAREKYRGSRFDWNGFISQAKFRGTTLLGEEKPVFQRNSRIYGRGLHNEFGIKKCVGYDDCAVGEWFPKIGTGWLRKDAKPYFFYTQYELEPLAFECEVSGMTEASFFCDSGARNGYGYRYEKRIRLEGPTFAIDYSLTNIGDKPLETDEYVHNFLCVGRRRVDEGLSLSFPWRLTPERFVETNNPDGVLEVNGNRIDVIDQTDQQFYLGGISEGVAPEDGLASAWTLTDARGKISLSEKSAFEPSAVHVWGWKSVISPEVFYPVSVAPGSTVRWSRVYAAASV